MRINFSENKNIVIFNYFRLSDYLNAKLDEKGSDEIVDLDQYLPQDILLEHAVETWKIACQKSEDYYNRAQWKPFVTPKH